MNICFFTSQHVSEFRGGVESVTLKLSEGLCKSGYTVYLLSAMKPLESDIMLERQFVLPNDRINSPENQSYVSTFIANYKIDIIINQSEVRAILELIKSSSPTTPVISVIHTDPAAATKAIQDCWDLWKLQLSPVKFTLLSPYLYIRKLYQIYTRKKYTKEKLQYYSNQSNAIVLLSVKFFDSFKKISCINDNKNLYAISNPHTVKVQKHKPKEKENIVLFVGRLVFQKRLDRLLKIWDCIKDKKDWKLIIIGDGPNRNLYETLCRKWNIDNIEFVGQCDPQPFYQKARILCITSSFEGSPCVLKEAMHNGLVPIAFNSFESASDTIQDKTNGILIKPFSINKYSRELEGIMHGKQEHLYTNIDKQTPFAEEEIYEQWKKLINTLILKKKNN